MTSKLTFKLWELMRQWILKFVVLKAKVLCLIIYCRKICM